MSDAIDFKDLNEMKPVYRRLFASEDGQAVLAHLRHITFGRVPIPEADEKTLRTLEAKRALVRDIENNAKMEG